MAGAIARIKELDAERAKLLDAAKREALAKAQGALADLTALGFHYEVVPRTDGKPAATNTRGMKRQRTNAPCSICNFRTNPQHDARAHRFRQGKKKKPFTSKELHELGLQKV